MKRAFLSSHRSSLPWLGFLLLVFLVFLNNHAISLWDQDEAAYAGFAYRMQTTGNWLVPAFPWSEIHRKTPLHFWNIALTYPLFGINAFSVRFSSSVFTLLTLALVFVAGQRFWGRPTAFWGMMVLGTSLLVPTLGKIAVTDATLLFFTTACGFALLFVLQERAWWAVLAFWISFALALLTKGPPIVIFAGLFGGLLLLLHPNRWNLLRLHPWFGLPLACLPLYYWGYLTTQSDGGTFINWLIDWYILKRINSSVLGQTGPPGTHLLGMLVAFLPYFLFFPQAVWQGIRGVILRDKNTLLLGSWFVAGWLIYEFSPSKLPAYVIAAHVPLALLIARQMEALSSGEGRPPRAVLWFSFGLTGVLFAGLALAPWWLPVPSALRITATAVGVVLLALHVFTSISWRKFYYVPLLVTTAFLFQAAAWGVLMPQVDQLKDATRRVALQAEVRALPNSRITIANPFGHPPSLFFYLETRFPHVEEVQDLDTLRQRYRSASPEVLVLNQEQWDVFQQAEDSLAFDHVSSFMTDRQGRADYFVLYNPAARKAE
ncbi:4-amino-4-deoxy-L-arabinose transferase [Catalinimonas alkaloidigena]|uniref:4-amino-4-deoxy-L-arabinose transferase n=1 Tax=Catalinimonas alkaloidigena TaxID=1075417 RepID=A0A1G9M4B7_9BACT|nr:glycosyltransferase family 39 protein [Catalinimonas alkaloidigena]SDL68545.1 4-amino-4-deoxy-L-arabinose transferase [Catalinimonas alkaloidigena]